MTEEVAAPPPPLDEAPLPADADTAQEAGPTAAMALATMANGGDGSSSQPMATKVVLQEGVPGPAYEAPRLGDLVTLRYAALSSSASDNRSEDETATFQLGSGRLPADIALAVTSMQKGEVVEVTSGAQTSADGCPARFRIELVRWKERNDLTGDGGISKVIVEHGDGPKPTAKATITARIRGVHGSENVVFDDRYDPPAEVTLDTYSPSSGIIDESIFVMLRSMRKGERSSFQVEPAYGFGADDDGPVPSTARLTYEIEMLEIAAADNPEQLPHEERVRRAEEAKSKGTELFKEQHYAEAVMAYSEVLGLLERDFLFRPEIKRESRRIKMAACLNIAACQLKLGQHKDVVGICTELISQNKSTTKAWYRRALAQEQLDNLREAKQDMTKALELSPNDKGIRRALQGIAQKIKEQDEKDKATMQGMFS
eukprot:m.94173 g.94173  ORF g.94173 m.94173 type:complete len:428 (-) comp15114_c0_seq1:139-1422(-)